MAGEPEDAADAGAAADADAEQDRPVDRVRALVERVLEELEPEAGVEVEETPDAITARVLGEEMGIVIGRHGATIDALQHLATRAAFRGDDERKPVVVDAAGYRERREAVLLRAADRAVEDALDTAAPVELEPMSASERRVVHTYLKDRAEVDTHSEGDEPERRLVVVPVDRDGPAV